MATDDVRRWGVFSPLMGLWAGTGPDYVPSDHPAVVAFAFEDQALAYIRECRECLPPDAEALRLGETAPVVPASDPPAVPSQDELRHLLCDVAQLLDGWHNDGTAWTEWDESVRRRVSEMQRRLEPR